MNLENMIEALKPECVLQNAPDVLLSGVSFDSRRVKKGHLFAALPGLKADGADYVAQAVKRGAAAILTERAEPLTDRPQLVVADVRRALGQAARILNGHPDLHLRIGGITGTNGKSTTAYLVRHLLNAAHVRCGMLGTVEYDLGAEYESVPAPLTTPDAPDLFGYLRKMVEHRCRAAVMEVSSHSLTQRRCEGIDFAVGAFTNLTQDHLDYHRTMEEYRDAKGILFRNLSRTATAVLNMDDSFGEYYAECTPAEVLGYSAQGRLKAELVGRVRKMDIQGTTFEVSSPWGRREVRWRMVGKHNVENALAALGVGLALGAGQEQTFNFDYALSVLEHFKGVPGRLESVGAVDLPFRVLVDYAHTDDALRSVLTVLSALRPSRLITVFGCGGDRDRTKRPKMGRVVEEWTDLGIVTSDNPRTEDPLAILADICEGIHKKQKFTVEPDRKKAIDLAIREARKGDVVLIAGKGHEDYQIIGEKKVHLDDREEARLALARRFGGVSMEAVSA